MFRNFQKSPTPAFNGQLRKELSCSQIIVQLRTGEDKQHADLDMTLTKIDTR